ncbi:MAG: hydantoinase/oxoprolinase family protein [Pseudomonadota bacterium]
MTSSDSYKIGVDVGGTFTDLFLWSSKGDVETFKVLSTPEDPSIGVLNGLETIAQSIGLSLGDFARQIKTIVHGTTVTTNAVLTRGGARCGLITTEGVRDALEMRRGVREEQYNNRYTNVVPLVPRHLRRPVRGRLDYQGKELAPLNLDDVQDAAKYFKAHGVKAVAICMMNSFADPSHEQKAKEIVAAELPQAYLSVSSDVLPVVRFYNRISTTVLNAYVGPVLGDYIGSLTAKLAKTGFGGVLLIMQSNGGVALPEITLKWPATTLLSGPAGGPKAAVAFVKAHGRNDCILVDMGGTSFDASLVRDGAAAMSIEGEIDRLRIALPMLAITTIGAGGGSIGWIDEGGLLRMGPQSAGALPGPACYGRGGEKPACTDADLLLGYLDPKFFAGGKLPLDVGRAQKAIETHIAKPLGLDVEQAAAGMYRVINANMAHGVREITVERGLDPREFPMVIAGGAGALHGCMIAEELEIPTLLVPNAASILCAAGMLLSDLQHDFVRSHISSFDHLDAAKLQGLVTEMVTEGTEQLAREGVDKSKIVHEVALDLRYLKQYHEVTLPVSIEAIEKVNLNAVAKDLHAEHNRLYGYDLATEGTTLELINVRVRSLGKTEKPTLPQLAEGSADSRHALKGHRRAFVPEKNSFEKTPVFDGHKLLSGNHVEGPALIERTDTTIFVSANYAATVDKLGSCFLERKSTEATHA